MATCHPASDQEIYQQLRQAVSAYPAAPSGLGKHYYRHPDGWYARMPAMVGAMVAQRHFVASDTDVLLVTFPKSGTTWLKALLLTAVHRAATDEPVPVPVPLTIHSPHQLIPFLESQVYVNNQIPDLSSLPAPRLFATHVPFQSLLASVATSGCKVVYLCRDPKDCFVSLWHFWNKFTPGPWDMDEALELFCDGVSLFGPYWEHVLGYWRWHVETPCRVLFLTYEELSADTLGQLRRLAEFVGRPFTAEEEAAGVDKGIVEACRMESLASLEVNRSGTTDIVEVPVQNGIFFRRGVVGDWPNHLTPEKARRVDEVTATKLKGSGLVLAEAI